MDENLVQENGAASMYKLLGTDTNSRLPHPQAVTSPASPPKPPARFEIGGMLTEIM
ncbi:MAG: hypothetical protein HZC54_22975 [Verrucomicrobia bacterium]|nr:hypothetical protein [Verrucomicrobiota bacterium]